MNPAILDLLNYYWADILTLVNTLALIVFGIKPKKGA